MSSSLSLTNHLEGALHDRAISFNIKLSNPFQLKKFPVFEASLPPKEFQQSENDAPNLTCGYSICWNKSGLHEVILGTTGRKQGTSSKGSQFPSTESSLCKKWLLSINQFSSCSKTAPFSILGIQNLQSSRILCLQDNSMENTRGQHGNWIFFGELELKVSPRASPLRQRCYSMTHEVEFRKCGFQLLRFQ